MKLLFHHNLPQKHLSAYQTGFRSSSLIPQQGWRSGKINFALVAPNILMGWNKGNSLHAQEFLLHAYKKTMWVRILSQYFCPGL